jgi:XTP/dITP diphosphohydrolase
MPLLVVPLATHESDTLTLGELDALAERTRVLFEEAGHPLAARLAEAGAACDVLKEEPDVDGSDVALVCDPESPRLLELARRGAEVMVGPASPPDALSAAHAAPSARRSGAALTTLAVIMARLRSDDGCPWDRKQSHESLKVHLLEEAHEVLEAIDAGADGSELAEELGDVLLQVAFHARIAEQDGRFTLADVADAIANKLLHRHPHVFGDVDVADADEVVRNWEALKTAEKGRDDPFGGIPKGLPALLAAYKTQKRAAQFGWHPDPDDARSRAAAAVADGDVETALFWLVALARAGGVDPESALLRATARFRAEVARPDPPADR